MIEKDLNKSDFLLYAAPDEAAKYGREFSFDDCLPLFTENQRTTVRKNKS